MMTHDLGRLFWHPIRVQRKTPPVHFARTYQPRWPFKWSNSVIISLFGLGVVIGWWREARKGLTTDQLLLQAIGGHEVGRPSLMQEIICSPQTCGRTHEHSEVPGESPIKVTFTGPDAWDQLLAFREGRGTGERLGQAAPEDDRQPAA